MIGNRIILAITISLTVLLSSFVLLDTERDVAAVPTRAADETLTVENGTVTIDKTSPQDERTWNKIIIGDDGELVVKGSVLLTQTIQCKPSAKNTSFRLIRDGQLGSTLTVQGGFVNIQAEEISIIGSTISVSNETETPTAGDDGRGCSVTLVSMDQPLLVNDSSINLQGQAAGSADQQTSGGDGGDAVVRLETKGDNEVNLSGSSIEAFGGKGGDAFAPGTSAGVGGDVMVEIKGNHLDIGHSSINGRSGDAGVSGTSSIGNSGGNSRLEMESYNSDMVLSYSTIDIETGDYSGQESNERLSFIGMTSKAGAILWDHEKTGDDIYRSVSSMKGDTIQMEAMDGSKLYEVDVGDNPPAAFAGTSVEIYWWAHVRVLDNTGSPMDQVAIRYFEPPYRDTLYPEEGAVFTDENGEAWLQVVGYRDDNPVRYTFTATDDGGASGSSDQIRFSENRNELIYINLTTITIVVPYSNGDLIGGSTVRFEGSAESGGERNVVNRVVVYIGDQVIGEAVDTSPESAPPFSTWLLEWDSTTVPDDRYQFSFMAFDNSYQATLRVDLVVDQESVPHPPLLDYVEVTDPNGVVEVPKGGSTDVHVSQKDNFIGFEVFIFDVDYRSDVLTFGKEIVSAEYRLIYDQTGEEILSSVEDQFQKKNESGGFTFEFEVDSSKKPGTSSALDDGSYTLEFDIIDDAERWIESQTMGFELFFDYYPNSNAYVDMIDGNQNEKLPQEDTIEDYEAFRDLSTDNSHTLSMRFNLTRSTDQDSPLFGSGRSYQNLTFTMRVRRKGTGASEETVISGEKGIPTVQYEFDLTDVPDGEEGSFDVWFDVTDEDGLEDTVRYIVRITHDPPEKEESIMGELTGADAFNLIDDGIMAIINPILFVLLMGATLGSMFLIMGKYNKDKKKKIDLLEKKRVQEREKGKDTSIDDEVSGSYMTTSKEYMESTGADKGKQDFSKQLRSESKSDQGSEQTSKPEQKPRQEPQQSQPQKPQAAGQKPPQQPRQPPAQQQKPQQPPQPPAVPKVPKPPQN